MSAQQWTGEDFERWLALQTLMGWRVTNPEAVEKIRAEFKKGATLSAPARETATTNQP
ncbi:MAG TPA: hypothetical protein VFU31_19360 [Candidatus Binatia bacterium]|nr:hypothetical protein [Candidatus Binatia bacterium]